MSDELIERLRAVKDWWRAPGHMAEEAADEIEHLRTQVGLLAGALENARGVLECVEPYFPEDSFGLMDIQTGIEQADEALDVFRKATAKAALAARPNR